MSVATREEMKALVRSWPQRGATNVTTLPSGEKAKWDDLNRRLKEEGET